MSRFAVYDRYVLACMLLVAFAISGAAPTPDVPQRIAVLDFHDSSEGRVRHGEILYLSDLVRGAARRTLPAETCLLMTRENILELLPQGRSLADCVGDCAVETGRNIGADFIITGDVTTFGGQVRVTVNLHEMQKGNLLGQVVAGSPDVLGIEKDLQDKVQELVFGLAVKSDKKAEIDGVAISSGIAPRMVEIPAGTFTMGSPWPETGRDNDERQLHVEITQGYYLSETEVTQAQYESVTGLNPSNFKGANRPVERVAWMDAIRFCNKLSAREGLTAAYRISGTSVTWDATATGYRLPTEAEWEYACRAGTATAYHTGESETDLAAAGWYNRNAANETQPVGKKMSNAWGLHDMHGGVWEWCWDWYGEYGLGSQRAPEGAAIGSHRVIRGGCWLNDAELCRSANRHRSGPSLAINDLGFRVARNAAR